MAASTALSSSILLLCLPVRLSSNARCDREANYAARLLMNEHKVVNVNEVAVVLKSYQKRHDTPAAPLDGCARSQFTTGAVDLRHDEVPRDPQLPAFESLRTAPLNPTLCLWSSH